MAESTRESTHEAPSMEVVLHTPRARVFGGTAARVAARGPQGRFTVLPDHADAVTPLRTGIVALRLSDGSGRCFRVDDGLLVKRGRSVHVCVFHDVAEAGTG